MVVTKETIIINNYYITTTITITITSVYPNHFPDFPGKTEETHKFNNVKHDFSQIKSQPLLMPDPWMKITN